MIFRIVMKKILSILVVAAALCSLDAYADEGMWMIQSIDKALEKKMKERGLKLAANEIYNADAEGATLTDAIVSLDFGCTGSIISDKGLVITNHHCAYGDVYKLSSDEKNYLEDGFWAMNSSEEVSIPGKSIFILKKVIDVTEQTNNLIAELRSRGKPCGMRKISFLMEEKYNTEEGMQAWFSSMWSSSKYYIAIYKVYKDIRLVAAPPVSMAAFGGDIDNWEWPQHKCDFAMYRIYTAPDGTSAEYSEENIPLASDARLEISLDGYKPGDYTMVIGFPGRTNRYSSSYEINEQEKVTLPISNRLRARQMSIIRDWMSKDPAIRLQYSDYYFGLSNVQELNEGEVKCFGRFGVVEKKREAEKELQAWIDAEPDRKAQWGSLLSDLKRKYTDVEDLERNMCYYRETLVRGTMIARTTTRFSTLRNDVLKKNNIKRQPRMPEKPGMPVPKHRPDSAERHCCRQFRFRGNDFQTVTKYLMNEYSRFDFDVERDLFRFSVAEFYENVDPEYFSGYQKELLAAYTRDGRTDYDAMAAYLWDNSVLTDLGRLEAFVSEEHTVDEYCADPLYRFYQEISIADFNRKKARIEGEPSIAALEQQLTHAEYQMKQEKGIAQYPDANSTMRITYGTVGDICPYDGVRWSWRSTPAGILEKYSPDSYEYSLNGRQLELYRANDWGRWGFWPSGSAKGKKGESKTMYVDFLTDNDITGGNSGSPVLNAEGKIIGLAFDGNKESLAGNAAFVDGYNKCVCVDIRFVLWTLDKYAGMHRILEEIGI